MGKVVADGGLDERAGESFGGGRVETGGAEAGECGVDDSSGEGIGGHNPNGIDLLESGSQFEDFGAGVLPEGAEGTEGMRVAFGEEGRLVAEGDMGEAGDGGAGGGEGGQGGAIEVRVEEDDGFSFPREVGAKQGELEFAEFTGGDLDPEEAAGREGVDSGSGVTAAEGVGVAAGEAFGASDDRAESRAQMGDAQQRRVNHPSRGQEAHRFQCVHRVVASSAP
jgi:hypothetical protein